MKLKFLHFYLVLARFGGSQSQIHVLFQAFSLRSAYIPASGGTVALVEGYKIVYIICATLIPIQ